jgi:hypothetical protein
MRIGALILNSLRRILGRLDADSVQARPIVGGEDGIRGIRGVIFHAGGLAGGSARQMKALFEAGDILRGLVGDAGNGIRVIEEFLCAVRDSAGPWESWPRR